MAGRDLSYAPWVPTDSRGLSDWVSPLTAHSLAMWDKLNGCLALAPRNSPLAPVGGYPWFSPGELKSSLGTWAGDGVVSLARFVEGGVLTPLTVLRSRYGSFPFDFWRHRQLETFITKCHKVAQIRTNLTEFERLWASEDPEPHLISVLYRLLEGVSPSPRPYFVREWERDLQTEFTDEQLYHLCRLTHKSSVDAKTQENNYKLLTRWYRVPTSLARIFPNVSDRCWRGCGQRGTLLHIWWECPVLRPFWDMVTKHVSEGLGVDIPVHPKHFLLHVHSTSLSRYKGSALPHLLNAAKRLIPIHWKSSQAPSEQDWLGKVMEIMEAEGWLATCRDTHEKFETTWAEWKAHVHDAALFSSSLDEALLVLADPSFGDRVRANRQSVN